MSAVLLSIDSDCLDCTLYTNDFLVTGNVSSVKWDEETQRSVNVLVVYNLNVVCKFVKGQLVFVGDNVKCEMLRNVTETPWN